MATQPGCQTFAICPALHLAPDGSRLPCGARLEIPFPARVRGTTQSGERFSLDTVLDGLSRSCLTLRLPWSITPGQPLFLVVALGAPAPNSAGGPRVALCGVVLWADGLPGNVWRVTVALTRHRFLYALAS
jgi:hypothetical protein